MTRNIDEALIWGFDNQRSPGEPWLWRYAVWLPLLELGNRAGEALLEASTDKKLGA